MTDLALPGSIEPAVKRPNLDKGFNPLTMILFGGILAGGLLFVAYSLYTDVEATGTKVTSYVPYILLFVALLIALGFEFVNGFHDTANAVATVIYTHSLPAEAARLGGLGRPPWCVAAPSAAAVRRLNRPAAVLQAQGPAPPR